jgi:hypothetical protein
MVPFDRHVAFATVDLLVLANERSTTFVNILSKLMDIFGRGILQFVRPLSIMPWEKLEFAFRLIAEQKHVRWLLKGTIRSSGRNFEAITA